MKNKILNICCYKLSSLNLIPPIMTIYSLFWEPSYRYYLARWHPPLIIKANAIKISPVLAQSLKRLIKYSVHGLWLLNSHSVILKLEVIFITLSANIKMFPQDDRNCGYCNMVFSNFHSSCLFAQCSFKSLQPILWIPNIHSTIAIFPNRCRLVQTHQEYIAAKCHSGKHGKFGIGHLNDGAVAHGTPVNISIRPI